MMVYIAKDFPTLINFVARVKMHLRILKFVPAWNYNFPNIFTIIYLHLYHFRIDPFFFLSQR